MKKLLYSAVFWRVLAFLLLVVLLGLISTYKITLPRADDMARHIKNGDLIIHGNFDILYQNVYSYTQPTYPVINHHWLSGVIYYLLFQVIGWNGLVVFKIILILITFTLLFWIALKRADFWLVAFFALPTILILMERTALRPENFSYLFLVIYLYILYRFEKNPGDKSIWLLLPLQILWVNMHIFFFMGPGLIWSFLIEKVFEARKNLRGNQVLKTLFMVAGFSILVCLVNPSGIDGVMYPFTIFKNYGVTVSENVNLLQVFRLGTYWSDWSVALYIPAIVLLIISFIFGFRKQQKPIFWLLVSVASAAAGFALLRAIVLFGMIFLPAITNNLNDVFFELKAKMRLEAPRITVWVGRALILLLLMVTGVFIFLFHSNRGIGLDYRSEDSAQFFIKNNLHGPIFNDYDAGSYILFNLFPKEKVWMDNRPEAYAAEFFNDINNPMIQDEDFWNKKSKEYNINTIFFYQYDQGDGVRQFLLRRANDPNWVLVYTDIYNIIFVRNAPENADVIKQFAITPQNAEEKLAYLVNSTNLDDQVTAADAFNMLGLGDLATQTFFNVLSKNPNLPKIWLVLGEWELGKTDFRSPILSMMFIDKAISLGLKTAEAYYYLGESYIRLNRPDNAKTAFMQALKINPDRQDAKDQLKALENNESNHS